jgi:hypothetical protein
LSVRFYDDAIIKHFRELFDDNRIHILPVENAIRFTAQLKQDNVDFPLISTNRTGWSIRTDEVNWTGMRIGGFQKRNDDGTNTFAKVIPIRITYQVDVFTVDKATGDDIIRELAFSILSRPTLEVDIPYKLDMKHNFNIFMDGEVIDNSDTVEHINKGVLFRNTFTMYTDDAYLFASNIQNHGNITGSVHTYKKREV